MTTNAETHVFQAETRQLLDLMIHSLYSHKEIFLRELVSNASDALDKRRLAGLTDETIRGDDDPRIRLEIDADARTLVIDDNGIGMTHDEIVENIGTIARSGTRSFLEQLQSERAGAESAGDGDDATAELIGQFGVGFYSAFMVAERVELLTRKAGGVDAFLWASSGDGSYTLEPAEKDAAGTRITLHLRAKDDATDADSWQDFTDEWTVRGIVKKYSDFVEYPVQMDVEREEGEGDDKRSVTKTETLNSMKPLWTKARNEITDEEHAEFYRHLSHDWNEPLDTIHFRAEGGHEYTALLYLPKQSSPDLLDPQRHNSRVSLYVKRVFVMAECEELLPPWLRFVRGLVDSADLPLNVSRETLQHDRQIGSIRKRLVKKVVEALGKLCADRRDEYEAFWAQLGPVVKEGLYLDDDNRETLLEHCLFETSAGEKLSTLAEVVERMPMAQKHLYYLTGPDRASLEQSPHLEALRAKGYEALLLTDPVDEFVVQRVTEFDGRTLTPLDRGELDLDDDESDDSAHEEKSKELAPLLEAVQKVLDAHVSAVRISKRLADSPALLVADENGLTPQMERILRGSGQALPPSKRVLELNADHAVVAKLGALLETAGGVDAIQAAFAAAEAPAEQAAEAGAEGGEASAPAAPKGKVEFSGELATFRDHAELLHGQALLAEGSPPTDPSRFAKLVGELLK